VGCLIAIVGFISGLIVGACAGFLVSGYNLHMGGPVWMGRAVIGGLSGGIFGGILGSISGDLNKASASRGGGRFFVAGVFGAIGGAMGGSRLQMLEPFLQSLNIPSPF
jgi:hypothetical protein